jgi:UDP-N-acetylmuramoyl-L-alanyl-D-glutamate--2,6-diaminopimelate ligase
MRDSLDDGAGDWSDPREDRSGRRQPEASRLTSILRRGRFIGCDEILFRSASDAVADCRPGDLFVARETPERDGHDSIGEAVSRGVAGVVAERMMPTFGVPLCVVPNAAVAFSRIAQALAGHPSRRLKLIAVTGTGGKTTTTWLTASILAEVGLAVGVLSDMGCLDGESAVPVPAGRGDRPLERPLVLARWLRRLVETGCTHAVVEVSSRQLADGGLAGVRCHTVAITNLATAHLDRHGTRSAYQRVTARILARLSRGGRIVVNADDPRLRTLAEGREGLVVGLSPHAKTVCGSTVERSLHGQTVLFREGGTMTPAEFDAPLASFARNALVAAGIARRYGVGLAETVRGLEAAGSLSGRLERCSFGQEFTAFSDSPTCRHQLATTLAGLRQLTRGRLSCAVSGGLAGELAAEAGVGGGLPSLLRRWCDDSIVIPAGPEGPEALARFARLVGSLATDDCLLLLDRRPERFTDPTDPSGESLPLPVLLEAWVESSRAVERLGKGRAA